MKQHRMVSWWFRPWISWKPLDEKAKDILRRRADLFAENGVDSAIVFGFHFRWDYMQFIDNVHEIIRFSANELHKRGILFWDHHSAVLGCNFNPDPTRFSRMASNPRQMLTSIDLPLSKDFHDDWKMIDITTGKPAFLRQYGAQEFCINNPDFRNAYAAYLKNLLSETEIDGLMCDDAFFYPGFYACGCPHCRKRYGKDLPPHTDLTFWGNWENKDFLAWNQMRHESVQDFNDMVASQLPADFPLMNCCSGSGTAYATGTALNIERYMVSSNHAMLEMCGNTPSSDGRYTHSIAMQLLQLAAARKKKAPLFGLGYGFSDKTASFIWAFNKFLGTSTWFSQLTHRMQLCDEIVQNFPEDAERVKKAFHAEIRFSDWFDAEHEGKAALLFSRNTMMNYGGYQVDYCSDYAAACNILFRKGWDFDVVLSVKDAEKYPVLFLSSCAMLSNEDRKALAERKNRVIACGPLDGIEVPRIQREPLWPNDLWTDREPVPCATEGGWRTIRNDFLWHPAKAGSGDVEFPESGDPVPAGWFRRTFCDRKGRTVTHYLASSFQVGIDEKLESMRGKNRSSHLFINRIMPETRIMKIPVPQGAQVLRPLDGEPETVSGDCYQVPEDCWYLIVRK